MRLAVALRDEAPLHARREAGAAAAAQGRVLERLDDLIGLHGQGLRQCGVAPGPPVARECERVRLVPPGAELGGRDRRPRCPPAVLGVPPSGVQPCCLATRRPASVGPPAVLPAVAWSSGKPARIFDACRQVHSTGAPRVGVTFSPERSESTRSLVLAGVMLSKNSQFTITTGA